MAGLPRRCGGGGPTPHSWPGAGAETVTVYGHQWQWSPVVSSLLSTACRHWYNLLRFWSHDHTGGGGGYACSNSACSLDIYHLQLPPYCLSRPLLPAARRCLSPAATKSELLPNFWLSPSSASVRRSGEMSDYLFSRLGPAASCDHLDQ